jgi:hypothetical protein
VSERGRGPLPHTRASERGRHEQSARAAASELGRPGARHAATSRPSHANKPCRAGRGAMAELQPPRPSWGAGELRRHGRAGGRRATPPRQAGGRRATPPRQAGGRRAAPPRQAARKAGAGPTTDGQAATAARNAEPGLRRERRAGRTGGRWRARQPYGRGEGEASAQGPRPHGRAPEAGRAEAAPRGLAALGAGRGERTPGRPRAGRAPSRHAARDGKNRGRGPGLEHAARDGEEERGRRGREGGRRGRAHLDDRCGGDLARARGKKGELREVREKRTLRNWRG